MTVTDITEYNKKKVLIELDGHLIFPLYKGEVSKYRIVAGEELEERICSELLDEILPKRVKLRAMSRLQKRSYTREGLRRKLLEGRYPENMVESALDYVTSYGYLDDDRYAEEYIRCYSESRSKRRIMQELYGKGINAESAQRVWEKFAAENAPVQEETQIMELIRKKGFCVEQADRKETLKMMNFLYRKGYSADAIRHCIYVNDNYAD